MGEPARRRRPRLPRLAPLAAVAMLMASECRADWRVTPALSVVERYTDNFLRESDDAKQSQFISEITPSLILAGKGRRFMLNGSAEWRNFHYRDDALRRTLDHSFEYALAGRGTLTEDLLYVDASASRRPRNISAFGPRVDDVPYLDENRATIESWRISPYLERRFGQQASVMVRYARDRVSGGNASGFADSNGDSLSANVSSGSAFGNLGWGLTHTRQELDDTIRGETSSEATTANLRYALTARVGMTASVGRDRYDFEGLGGSSGGSNWSLGFDWTPSLRTRLEASFGRHFYGQTGRLALLHRSRHTVWNILYDDGVTTSRQQFLLPAALDTAAMLDQLFSTSFPDAALRQQAVAAYIRDNGLPPTLTDNINYLSNRYFRQRGWHGSMAYRFPRTTGVVSVFDNDRLALSSQQSDSPLLGNQLNSLNDNVRQRGVNASVNYRLNPRSSAVASANWTRSRSLTTEYGDIRREFHLGLIRQLGQRTRVALDLRRSAGNRGGLVLDARPYHEHSISASLSAQF